MMPAEVVNTMNLQKEEEEERKSLKRSTEGREDRVKVRGRGLLLLLLPLTPHREASDFY